MSFNVVRFDDVKPQPWKNAGGVTRELLAWPNADDWVMRLSVADIEHDGPFSKFPGVDRWFAVLSGNGVRLGAPTKTIQYKDGTFHFDGAIGSDCELIDGPTRDLNLMIRRDAANGWMKRVVAGFEFPHADQGVTSSTARAPISGVFAVNECTLRQSGSPVFFVEPMSLAWRTEPVGNGPSIRVDCCSSSAVFGFQCIVLK